MWLSIEKNVESPIVLIIKQAPSVYIPKVAYVKKNMQFKSKEAKNLGAHSEEASVILK